jgi:predicted aspartyl protease
MITGVVNDEIEAMLTVRVRSDGGLHAEISAQIDTGFSGALILPAHDIDSDLPFLLSIETGAVHGRNH